MTDNVIHKRKQASQGSGFPRSICGVEGGFVTALWKNVTCAKCLELRK